MPAMAGVLLPDGSHTYLTNRWREYSGLSVAETDSGGWRRAVHPEDIDAHVEKFRAAAAARKPFATDSTATPRLKIATAHAEPIKAK